MSKQRHISIAFDFVDGSGWTGGAIYLKNLILGLQSVNNGCQIKAALVVPPNTHPDGYGNFASYVDRVIELPIHVLQTSVWKRLSRRVLSRLGMEVESGRPVGSYLQQEGVDVIFSMNNFGPHFRLPLLSWIPDFQHMRMPQMFSREEIRARNQLYLDDAMYANQIVLSSQSALTDFNDFAPAFVAKARVVPFVAHVPQDIFHSDPQWICHHYRIPKRFVFLPNQFWKHKNHECVLEALCLAKEQHPDICIVCTGATYDYRNPHHFSTLLAKISVDDLRDNVIILGLIPHEHTFQLMRQSIAVLQPSLFEGWSTTIEEVKSVGKRVIVSDIPVHREQDPPKPLFFNPSDPEALSRCLIEVFEGNECGPDYELEADAKTRFPQRLRKFGQDFVNVVQEVTSI